MSSLATSLRCVVPCRWLAVALFAVLTIPRLVQLGMFFDGVRDAAIARNMAEGNGSFWAPAYTQTLYPRFFEHPPLALGLQSLAFRAAGDHPAVERAYAVVCGALTAVLVALVWRRTVGDTRGDWLPVIFWLVPASVTWAIVNNMVQTTQAVFTTAATLAAISAVAASRTLSAGVVAGVLVAAAVLVKGPVGLFPLIVPALLAGIVLQARAGRAAAATAIMIATVIGIGLVLVWNRPSREALDAYLHSQVIASLAGAREVAPSRLQFVSIVGGGILLRMLALLGILWVATGRPRPLMQGEPWMRFFLALALCASLPIAISPKLMGHYFVPSTPFFALACAVPAWRWIVARLHREPAPAAPAGAAGIAAAFLIVLTIAIPLAHGAVEARDVGLLRAIQTLSPALPRGGVVATCPVLASDWPMHAYLQRFYRVSLDAKGPHPLYLRAMDAGCPVPDGCLLIRFTTGLELYSCAEGVAASR